MEIMGPEDSQNVETIESSPSTEDAAAAAHQQHPERRSSPRLHCNGRAFVNMLDGEPIFSGRVHNLSSGGCRIWSREPSGLPYGAQVEIVMDVDGIRFRVAGIIRFEDTRNGVGVEFQKLSRRCEGYVRDLLAELEAFQQPHSFHPASGARASVFMVSSLDDELFS